MANVIKVQVNQVGPTTSQGVVRHHNVLVDRPGEKGGDDCGAMGGELLLVALGGCFNSNLLATIRARDAAVSKITISVEGTLDGTPIRFTRIHMAVTADFDDRTLAEKLLTISERSCIVANTLKDVTDLSISLAENPTLT
jgi:putative redox protein